MNALQATGLKLICERSDGEITTWHDTLETTVEDVINKIKHQKRWMGGEITKAYIEFDNKGDYYKVHIDTSRINHLLQEPKA